MRLKPSNEILPDYLKTNTNNQIILCMLNQILGYDENPKMAD